MPQLRAHRPAVHLGPVYEVKRATGARLDIKPLIEQIGAMAASSRVQEILSLATKLSREECEQVAEELLSALEPGEATPRQSWDDSWRDELARRAADSAPGIPLAEVRRRVDDALTTAKTGRSR